MERVLIMELCFNQGLALGYKNESQRVRAMSEDWIANNIGCPCCGYHKLNHYENNRPVADFYCENCGETFELKSKSGPLGRKIVDGAYKTAIERITSNTNPSLFVLQYNEYSVVNLEIIPKYFFTPNIIEARKPLAESARRHGWQGCNIIFGDIPEQGRIPIIKDKELIEQEKVVNEFEKTTMLKVNDISKRGWLFDILKCVNSIRKDEFTLNDMYKFEEKLKKIHPDNNNVKPKIRQQLQLLRDKGYIEFIGNGIYRKIS
ncbi:MAG: DpnI domain-containing protein [bacterium]|nr:DpnI domain-containing protein [bacterium]